MGFLFCRLQARHSSWRQFRRLVTEMLRVSRVKCELFVRRGRESNPQNPVWELAIYKIAGLTDARPLRLI